ncbi:MAG: 1-deoxy-D-xylulose-5-phosphate reductoisomerase [Candidatus Rickettsiella isopodorum]|jgi:1-deoxy-D-xylulose-5-phosphate reductoisomerase|nr:1-deoxy-D-xylulose-5-phosphate reductoisomerase [Gammaproteobacteria bacterium]MDD4892435.1 1-deoxy-D-xylulose-5-phosphate reductoisomerase [Candidatus Rickettsiella isopodorum]MDD5162210.1 1-deoxy-D-xylulose-5-phosphate reductoisomerase [Candidatus Rickettsiella isopodorum]MDQ5900345.1 1-deoxy-D-xylulose-5-phosphate reductoisomerase [Pseudomonadota bacterium]
MKSLSILGATGSIGVHTLDVISEHPTRFNVIALTAHYNIDLLFQQCLKFIPTYAVVSSKNLAENLQQRLRAESLKTEVLFGRDALAFVATLDEVDTVMAAIVGAAGLLPTLAAIKAKKQILLANKEALIMAGPLFIEEAQCAQISLIPVDSEHNAIFQCLQGQVTPGDSGQSLSKIILTASGGALRHKSLDQLQAATPVQACQHPNWSMGRKISVDSATLMNKGFEVIEAYFLFGLTLDQIEVVLHPQSIIHSLVEYLDGSLLAQLGSPDMRIPISYALGFPERINNSVASLDLLKIGRLDFLAIDAERYPCLDLAYLALRIGGTATTILNAANEIAVQAFLDGKIYFTDIAKLNRDVLEKIHSRPVSNLSVILEDDNLAREIAKEMILKHYSTIRKNAVKISHPLGCLTKDTF